VLRFRKRCIFVSAFCAIALRILCCGWIPCGEKLRPNIVPCVAYSMGSSSMVMLDFLRREMAMSLNLLVFVLIFHCFSKLFICSIARFVYMAA